MEEVWLVDFFCIFFGIEQSFLLSADSLNGTIRRHIFQHRHQNAKNPRIFTALFPIYNLVKSTYEFLS